MFTATNAVLAICCIAIAGMMKGPLDHSSENGFANPFWNKGFSFYNKWKCRVLPDGTQERILYTGKRLWYYGWLFTPKYVERFPYSSTIFVFTTDGWHLLQLFYMLFDHLAVAMCAFPDTRLMLILFLFSWYEKGMKFSFIRRFVLKNKT